MTLEQRIVRAAIEWRKEEKIKHENDCACVLCVKLGLLLDRLIDRDERIERMRRRG